MLKIKDNVDHAGLSLPPDPWKEPWLSKDWESNLSLNNNWLTVLPKIMDVTEDLWTTPSPMLKMPVPLLNLTILITPAKTGSSPAKKTKSNPLPMSNHGLMSNPEMLTN